MGLKVSLALALAASLSLAALAVYANHQRAGHQTATGNYLSSSDAIAQEIAQNLGSSPRGREVKVEPSASAYGSYLDSARAKWADGTGTTVFFRNDAATDPDVHILATNDPNSCPVQLGATAVVTDEGAGCGIFLNRPDFTMPDSLVQIWAAAFDSKTEDIKKVGMIHELGHTLGIEDHYLSSTPSCRSDVKSVMENWGCHLPPQIWAHDNQDFQAAFRIFVAPSPAYLHPAGAPDHSLAAGSAELHFGGASNIHNEKQFWNHSAERPGTPVTEAVSPGPNVSTLIVSIPSAIVSNNNMGVCKRAGASSGAYGANLLGVGPPTVYTCTKYGENLSGPGTLPKYYVETDTVGNTVFVYVYNVGTQWLYHVHAVDTGTFNTRCVVATTEGVAPGNVRSCSFTATADGVIDLWSFHAGTPNSGLWSAISTLDFDR